MSFTDKTIEIECPECNEAIVGVVEMTLHILSSHKNYSIAEAPKYARLWADDAYEQMEEQERDWDIERRLDREVA